MENVAILARVPSALPKFHGNTSSITAKLCLVSTQNLLANHSCSIMRYCLNDIRELQKGGEWYGGK